MEPKDYKMTQTKKKRWYGGVLFIVIIFLVLFFIKITPPKERNLPPGDMQELPPRADQTLPSKVDSSAFRESDRGRNINPPEKNITIEGTEIKADDFGDRIFNELMEKEVTEAAYKMEEDLALRKHLDSMKETDRELAKKWDLPADVLGETSTDRLFLHFIRSPLTSFIKLYLEDETRSTTRLKCLQHLT